MKTKWAFAVSALSLTLACAPEEEENNVAAAGSVVSSAELAKPAEAELLAFTTDDAVEELQELAVDEWYNSEGSSSSSDSDEELPCEFSGTFQVDGETLTARLTLDTATCKGAAAQAPAQGISMDFGFDMFISATCKGGADQLAKFHGKAFAEVKGDDAMDKICVGLPVTQYLEGKTSFKVSGSFGGQQIDSESSTIMVTRSAEGVGCTAVHDEEKSTLQGMCEVLEIEKIVKDSENPEKNGKTVYRRAVETDIVEPKTGWASAGSATVEINNVVATFTFSAEDPSYNMTSPEAKVGTFSTDVTTSAGLIDERSVETAVYSAQQRYKRLSRHILRTLSSFGHTGQPSEVGSVGD